MQPIRGTWINAAVHWISKANNPFFFLSLKFMDNKQVKKQYMICVTRTVLTFNSLIVVAVPLSSSYSKAL